MHFLERESNALKFYLEKELAPICDADPKVLADYILALLKHDYPINELRANIKSDLADFMEEKEQEPFLENLFQSLNDHSYLDVQTDDDIEIEYVVEDPSLLETNDYNNNYVDNRDQHNQMDYNGRESRRDDYRDRDRNRDRDRDLYTRDFNNRNREDSRDDSRGRERGRDYNRRKRPCYAFQRGQCDRGEECRFSHEDADERRSRSRSRSPGLGRRKPRFQKGMGFRTTNVGEQKILIVNQIPEEYCNIAQVHEYFSKFGNLVDCQVKPERQSAKLEFENHSEAMACYSSPDVIFNNRFVKVFWSSEEEAPGARRPRFENQPPQPVLTPEELKQNLKKMQEKTREMQRQQELQKLEAQKKKTELARQGAELIAKQMQEQTQVMERLRNPDLSVEERQVLMNGLEILQQSIKSLMSQQPKVSPVGTPRKPLNAAAPAFVPSFKARTSERSFALPAEDQEELLKSKRIQYANLQAQAAKEGSQANQKTVAQMAQLQAELYPTHAQSNFSNVAPQAAYGKKSMKLDLRPKAFVILDTTIDMEDAVAAYYSKMSGFEGVESRGNTIIVKFSKRHEAEYAFANPPPNSGKTFEWLTQ